MVSLIAGAPDGEACICDLIAPVDLAQPTVWHHMKVLVDAGLLHREQRGRWAYYRLEPGALDASRLDDQGAVPVPCLVHQPERPGGAYATGSAARTGAVLQLLRYYTANGNKAYCDGRGPSANDVAWAKLYVQHGADPAKVDAVLHPPAG